MTNTIEAPVSSGSISTGCCNEATSFVFSAPAITAGSAFTLTVKAVDDALITDTAYVNDITLGGFNGLSLGQTLTPSSGEVQFTLTINKAGIYTFSASGNATTGGGTISGVS